MIDGVPTRDERIAAVVGVVALAAAGAFAAFGYAIVALPFPFVGVTCVTIAKARVDLESLLEFGVGRVPDDDPAAERYRERRRRDEVAARERIERADGWIWPRLETAVFVGLALAGFGALAAVPIVVEDDQRRAGRLLVFALFALNAALIGYAVSRTSTGKE